MVQVILVWRQNATYRYNKHFHLFVTSTFRHQASKWCWALKISICFTKSTLITCMLKSESNRITTVDSNWQNSFIVCFISASLSFYTLVLFSKFKNVYTWSTFYFALSQSGVTSIKNLVAFASFCKQPFLSDYWIYYRHSKAAGKYNHTHTNHNHTLHVAFKVLLFLYNLLNPEFNL